MSDSISVHYTLNVSSQGADFEVVSGIKKERVEFKSRGNEAIKILVHIQKKISPRLTFGLLEKNSCRLKLL